MFGINNFDLKHPIQTGFSLNNGMVYTTEEAPEYRNFLPDRQYNATSATNLSTQSTYNTFYDKKPFQTAGNFANSREAKTFRVRNDSLQRLVGEEFNQFTKSGNMTEDAEPQQIRSFDQGSRRNCLSNQATVPYKRNQDTYTTTNQVFTSYVKSDPKQWKNYPKINYK